MTESSLSRQTYLAPFIVPNKSISPGLSHLPLDCWLPAPHLLPLGFQVPGPSSGLPGVPPLLGHWAGGPPYLLRAPMASPTSSQGILRHICPPSFCDGLCSAALLLNLQSELGKGHSGLGGAGIMVLSTQLGSCQSPAPLKLASFGPTGACFGGPREPKKYLALLYILIMAPLGPSG